MILPLIVAAFYTVLAVIITVAWLIDRKHRKIREAAEYRAAVLDYKLRY